MKSPLQDAAAHGLDRVLGVRVEVEAEALAVLAVAGPPQLERELERLHERGRADHVVVVERAPAGVRVLVAEQPLGGEQRRVLAEVLAVHDQVLPVHVDLDVVDPLGAQLVDDVQRHADVAHEDLHRGLGVLVLQEQLARRAWRTSPRPGRSPSMNQRPAVGVRRLERVVVALDPGPEHEVRAERSRRSRPPRASAAAPPRGSPDRATTRPPLAEARVEVQPGADRVDAVAVERRRAPRRGCPARARPGSGTRSRRSGRRARRPRGAPSRPSISLGVLGLVAAGHEARDHRAERPDAEARAH